MNNFAKQLVQEKCARNAIALLYTLNVYALMAGAASSLALSYSYIYIYICILFILNKFIICKLFKTNSCVAFKYNWDYVCACRPSADANNNHR